MRRHSEGQDSNSFPMQYCILRRNGDSHEHIHPAVCHGQWELYLQFFELNRVAASHPAPFSLARRRGCKEGSLNFWVPYSPYSLPLHRGNRCLRSRISFPIDHQPPILVKFHLFELRDKREKTCQVDTERHLSLPCRCELHTPTSLHAEPPLPTSSPFIFS